MTNYLAILLLFCMQYMSGCIGSYYWKNYHGQIPVDAFDVGKDINGEKAYIGQAFIKTDTIQGIYPTRIIRGEDVYVPVNGAIKADNFIQILCSNDPDKFKWLPANSTHLHLIQNDNEMVRGGLEDDTWVNIGRLKYQGGTVVGKVLAAYIGNAEMWFVYNHDEVKADSYEVLTYNHSNIANKMIVANNNKGQKNGFYYWKDYNGKVPVDAFGVGKDINEEKVYIGQVFIKTNPSQGIYPTSIIGGKHIYAPVNGALKADNFIQILCSNDPGNFEWLPANTTHLHLIKTDNEMVRGGLEDDAWVNIGRLKYQGATVIGKVLAAYIGNAEMWFVHNHDEVKADSYEVLTYNDIFNNTVTRNRSSERPVDPPKRGSPKYL